MQQHRMSEDLSKLIELAKTRRVTKEELRAQREAFVYGNLPKDQPATRADVAKALAKLDEVP